MPMWHSETRRHRPAWRAAALQGFTLLELMVVMVLLALLASTTLPALNRWHAAVQARTEASLALEALRAQAFRAGALRRDLLLDLRSFNGTSGAEPGIAKVDLPPGWVVRRVVSTVFRSNGLCGNGLVALSSAAGSPLLILIHGPSCEFSWQADPSAAQSS